MAPEQRLNPEERANLVAYLDGELTDAESRSIATKLTQSATARREADSLKRTWELLDLLPRPAASPQFTERTQTALLGLDAGQGKWTESAGSWFRRVGQGGMILAIAAALAGAGYAITRWVLPDPRGRLVRDLTLAEHFDEYREVGSFEFLDELARSPEFGSSTR